MNFYILFKIVENLPVFGRRFIHINVRSTAETVEYANECLWASFVYIKTDCVHLLCRLRVKAEIMAATENNTYGYLTSGKDLGYETPCLLSGSPMFALSPTITDSVRV